MNHELYHFGIKKQKWGVRRFQNKDGSLTAAGKKRYYDTPELNAQKENVKRMKREAYQTMSVKKFNEYLNEKRLYETNKEVERIKSKNVQFKNKSKHRLKLEQQYKELGMTDEQAQAAANNKIRTEKILAVSAGVAVTAVAAYAANKAIRQRVDGVIKSGTKLQRIEGAGNNGELHDVFYASKGKHDNTRYANLYKFDRMSKTGKAKVLELQTQNDIKVASEKNAKKIFDNLKKTDPEFAKTVDKANSAFRFDNMKNDYHSFNRAIPDLKDDPSYKKFFDALKKEGYGAIGDVNDKYYSGYNAKNPLIFFGNNESGNIMTKTVSEVSKSVDDLVKPANRETIKAAIEGQLKQTLPARIGVAGAALTGAAIYEHNSKPKDYSNGSKKGDSKNAKR